MWAEGLHRRVIHPKGDTSYAGMSTGVACTVPVAENIKMHFSDLPVDSFVIDFLVWAGSNAHTPGPNLFSLTSFDTVLGRL